MAQAVISGRPLHVSPSAAGVIQQDSLFPSDARWEFDCWSNSILADPCSVCHNTPMPTSLPIVDAMDTSPLPDKPAFQAMRNPVSLTQDRGMKIFSSPPSTVPKLPRRDPQFRRGDQGSLSI